jgi:predicted dehydrogenase
MMIRIGVIGCGYWGPNLIRNFIETKGAKLVEICDLNPETLGHLKLRYPFIRTSTDFTSLVERDDIDAIAIATPIETHFKLAKACLNAGKHVLLEKPMTGSSKEAEELIALAESKHLTLMVDHTFVYDEAVRTLKKHFHKIGQPRYFDSTRVNLGLFQKKHNVIWDLAPHDFSILFHLIDEDPLEVMAVGTSHLAPGVENTAYVVARFQNNFIAHFHFNWLSPVKVRQTLIGGTDQMIVYNDLDSVEPIKIYDYGVDHHKDSKESIMVNYRRGDVYSPQVASVETLKSLCRDFIDSITIKRAPLSDGRLGLRIVNLLEACDQSLKSKSAFVKVKKSYEYSK